MSVQSVHCPGCKTALNIPVGMSNIRCPSCETTWNANRPDAAVLGPSLVAAQQASDEAEESRRISTKKTAMIAALVSGAMALIAIVGISMFILGSQPPPSPDPDEFTIKPSTPVEYREVNLPEEQRRQIYADYRKVARTTVEAPLMLPQGTEARRQVERTLNKTFERELHHFALLHDLEIKDVEEIIKEGDSKVWDSRPRSNAVRDGKRMYSREMSEGWEKNPNIR